MFGMIPVWNDCGGGAFEIHIKVPADQQGAG
jgi:hypothetical protein